MCRKIRCDTLRWKFLGTKQGLTWIISPKALHSPQFGKVAAKHSPTSVSSQRFLQAALCVQNPGSNEWWPFRQDRSISNVVAIQTDHHKSTDFVFFSYWPLVFVSIWSAHMHTDFQEMRIQYNHISFEKKGVHQGKRWTMKHASTKIWQQKKEIGTWSYAWCVWSSQNLMRVLRFN